MSEKQQSQAVIKGLALALSGFAIFSAHDALVKVLADYSVFQTIFFAMLFGYVPFSLVMVSSEQPLPLRPKNPALVIFRALLTVAGLCFSFLGFSLLPMVENYILLFCTPLIISVLAIIFLNESIALIRWFAILLGLAGVLVVLRPSPESLQLGHLFGICAAFCGAGAAIISRKIGHMENAATLIIFPLIANILVTGSILVMVYKPMPLQDLAIMFLIGVLGLAGQLLILYAHRAAPAATIAPTQYSQIIWAVILGSVFFGETIDHYVIIGSAITVSSGLLILWRETSVSKVKPNLNTRNTRMVIAALLKTREIDNKHKPH